jgi:hypothetical protein
MQWTASMRVKSNFGQLKILKLVWRQIVQQNVMPMWIVGILGGHDVEFEGVVVAHIASGSIAFNREQ